MRIRFIKTTKKEGSNKYYKGIPKAGDSHENPTEIAISRELGDKYVSKGVAVEIDPNGDVIKEFKKKDKIKEDGEV